MTDDTDPDGVWVAYYFDQSAAYVFASEIDALRVAVGGHMQVEFRQFGACVFTGVTP